jgi:hypothetical protein
MRLLSPLSSPFVFRNHFRDFHFISFSLRHLTLVCLSTTVLNVFKNVLFVEDRVGFHGRCVELELEKGGELEFVDDGFRVFRGGNRVWD